MSDKSSPDFTSKDIPGGVVGAAAIAAATLATGLTVLARRTARARANIATSAETENAATAATAMLIAEKQERHNNRPEKSVNSPSLASTVYDHPLGPPKTNQEDVTTEEQRPDTKPFKETTTILNAIQVPQNANENDSLRFIPYTKQHVNATTQASTEELHMLQAKIERYQEETNALRTQLEVGNQLRIDLQESLSQTKIALQAAQQQEAKETVSPLEQQQVTPDDSRVTQLQDELQRVQINCNQQLATMQHQMMKAQQDYESRLTVQRDTLTKAFHEKLIALQAQHDVESKSLLNKVKESTTPMQIVKEELSSSPTTSNAISQVKSKALVPVGRIEKGVDVITAAIAVSFLFAW